MLNKDKSREFQYYGNFYKTLDELCEKLFDEILKILPELEMIKYSYKSEISNIIIYYYCSECTITMYSSDCIVIKGEKLFNDNYISLIKEISLLKYYDELTQIYYTNISTQSYEEDNKKILNIYKDILLK